MERAQSSQQGSRFGSANDRFKSRWNRWVGWSTALAAVAHFALLALVSWQALYPEALTTSFDGRALSLLPPSGEGSPAGDAPRPPLPVDAVDESTPPGAEEERGTGIEEADGDLWAALSDRLRDRGELRPTLAESTLQAQDPEPDPEAETESAGEGDDPSVDDLDAMIDLSLLPETDSLDLDRLAALEPELAVAAPSAWVLIRNPLEVEAFLRSSYEWGRIDPGASGSVSVTLWIDERGSVEWAEISRSSGDRSLDEFALAVFNEVAVFRPAREEGVRVSRSVSFALNFPW